MPPRKPKKGQSLADLHPELIEEWSPNNDLTPWDYGKGSDKAVWWVCGKGHEDFISRISNRVYNHQGCPKCGRIRSIKKSRTASYDLSLQCKFPQLATEWSNKNTDTPDTIYPISGIKYWWKCSKGIHEDYEATCAHRVREHSGCPKCGRENFLRVPKKYQSLEYLYPKVSLLWSNNNLCKPSEVFPGENRIKRLWICPEHGEYKSTCQTRCRAKSKCPYCSCKNTSHIETNLRTSLSTYGFSQELRSKVGHWNVDLINLNTNTVLEFDGSYYHSLKGAYARDRKKSLDLLSNGYRVIRIRERTKKYQLKSLRISKKLDYHEIFWDNNYTSVYPENVDSEVLEEIKTLVLQPNYI